VTDTEQPRTPGRVWYVGYGSNLCAERFRCYIAGGIPPGLTDPCRGARDRTPPREDRPLDIKHRLYFAGISESWGGSPCFLDTVVSPDSLTLGRAYLVTWGQFEDVVTQENGRPTSSIDLDSSVLTEGRSVRLGLGSYQNLLCLGTLDGFPIVTITSPRAMSSAELGAPSSTYLKVMIAGLRETRAMRDDAIVDYLASAPGCSEVLVVAALAPADESEG
jgi:hypothetical protein